jgi:Uma2 family endonuclease
MSATILIPVEEYLSRSYEPDREYIDGLVLERNVGEHDHSRLQYLIAAILERAEGIFGFRGFTEQRLRVGPNRYRIPDVLVMPSGYTRQRVIAEPPLLIIEILSPDDSVSEMLTRITDYRRLGVPNIWIVDPYQRKLLEVREEGAVEIEDRVAELRVPGREQPFVIAFNELFDRLS